jgi:hypothetical protein
MLEQLVLLTPKTFHTTSKQDLSPRPCSVNDHPSVLTHEMMVIEPGEKPTLMLTWKTTSFLSHIQTRSHDDLFPVPLWETWFCQSLGVPIPSSTVAPHSSRLTIKLDRLIVLSKSSLLGWFLHVSLIVIIKGRSPVEVSLIVIIKPDNQAFFTTSLPSFPSLPMIHRTKQMTGQKSNIIFEVPTRLTVTS